MTPDPLTIVAVELLRWDWIARNADYLWELTVDHIVLTVLPVLLGVLIAFPLSLLAVRYPRLYGPLLGFTGVLFTIPSIALFVLMLPFTGLTLLTALLPLTLYTLLILLRNTVEGLVGVPQEVREAAEAMGYTRTQRLFRVELPLAVPVIVAGLRIATVTTIGLVTITVFVGEGGLGRLFIDAFRRLFPTPALVGLLLTTVLSFAADLGLLGAQRLATPWARRED